MFYYFWIWKLFFCSCLRGNNWGKFCLPFSNNKELLSTKIKDWFAFHLHQALHWDLLWYESRSEWHRKLCQPAANTRFYQNSKSHYQKRFYCDDVWQPLTQRAAITEIVSNYLITTKDAANDTLSQRLITTWGSANCTEELHNGFGTWRYVATQH